LQAFRLALEHVGGRLRDGRGLRNFRRNGCWRLALGRARRGSEAAAESVVETRRFRQNLVSCAGNWRARLMRRARQNGYGLGLRCARRVQGRLYFGDRATGCARACKRCDWRGWSWALYHRWYRSLHRGLHRYWFRLHSRRNAVRRGRRRFRSCGGRRCARWRGNPLTRKSHAPKSGNRLGEFQLNIPADVAIILRLHYLAHNFLLGFVVGKEQQLTRGHRRCQTNHRAIAEHQHRLRCFRKGFPLVAAFHGSRAVHGHRHFQGNRLWLSGIVFLRSSRSGTHTGTCGIGIRHINIFCGWRHGRTHLCNKSFVSPNGLGFRTQR
jgi:hypothetical protein